MAQRIWRIAPDHLIDTPEGQIEAVSQDALIKGVVDGVVAMQRIGGVLMVMQGRARTGIPGEMVTTEALVTWQDRAVTRPQAEEPVALTPAQPETPAEDSEEPVAQEA